MFACRLPATFHIGLVVGILLSQHTNIIKQTHCLFVTEDVVYLTRVSKPGHLNLISQTQVKSPEQVDANITNNYISYLIRRQLNYSRPPAAAPGF